MAMINSGTYEFNSICNLMDFVKPLVVEGYSVAINTIFICSGIRDYISLSC